MRSLLRVSLVAVTALAVAACSGDDPSAGDRADGSDVTLEEEAALHPDLEAFVEDAAAGADASFTATYATLQKLGGVEAKPTVRQDGGAAVIEVDDLVVVTGREAATCRISAEACVEGVREDRLAGYGLFSGFYRTGPIQTLMTLGRRPDAEPPVPSERTIAGVRMRCASMSLDGQVANTTCLTPEGVVGFVDTAARRVELAEYAPGAPDEPIEPPFPVGDDTSIFLD